MVDRTFKQAMMVVIGVCLVGGILIVLPTLIHDNFAAPLHKYLTSASREDMDGAYAMLCTEAKGRISAEVFQTQLASQLKEIGKIKRIENLRGEKNIGTAVLFGELKSVIVDTPMKKEGGRWKPCPVSGPLDHLEPYK
jgi:hypothetical protein